MTTAAEWLSGNFTRGTDRVLITGGSSGIGRAYLEQIASLGYDCIIVSEAREELESVAKQVRERFRVEVDPIHCDLSDAASLDRLLDGDLRGLHIPFLINNAGFGLKGFFLDIPPERYRAIIAVNAVAPTLITHRLLPPMIEAGRGVIVHVASINVASPIPKNAVYTATKSYIWSYALALSSELEDSGILLQTCLPGTTNTPFHVKQGATPQSMTMAPDQVASGSLANLHRRVFIPNPMDRVLYPIVSALPVALRMKIASHLMKKRLGV